MVVGSKYALFQKFLFGTGYFQVPGIKCLRCTHESDAAQSVGACIAIPPFLFRHAPFLKRTKLGIS
jgi:hypothetical protein